MKSMLWILIIPLMAFECENDLAFEDFDEDENGTISMNEFADEFEDNYDRDWDYNDDGILDNEDFYYSSYYLWDTDDDDYLTAEEWTYVEPVFGDYSGSFVDVDVDGDNYIVYDEYYNSLYDSDLYTVWDIDRDNQISEEELAENIFNSWDTDRDGSIEKNEYQRLDDFYAGL